LYFLFERKETVILGVPNLDLVRDKWQLDLKPIIDSSRYKSLMPSYGGGSKEGESILYRFRNGAALRFMTAGGGDQARSSFTSKNLLVTEADGFDKVGAKSREGDKFSQLERRLLAFAGGEEQLIAECTPTTETGRTWSEYQQGTQSRLALPCPHCKAYVTPEREHLSGWQDAATSTEAAEKAAIACPACGGLWTNQQRIDANYAAVVVHRGQTVNADGTVSGPLPGTDTLGYRWTAVNTVINPRRLAVVAAEEWKAQRAADEDAAETELRQRHWVLPTKPAASDVFALDPGVIASRAPEAWPRGICPPGTIAVTVGCDVGKRLCHWAAVAWLPGATPHVIDYSVAEVPSDHMGIEEAVLVALREWRDKIKEGWPLGGVKKVPALVFIDAGWQEQAVYRFADESGAEYFASRGFGAGQRHDGQYKRQTGSKVVGVGDHYNLVKLADGHRYVEVNADHWKGWLHARLLAPLGKPGGLTVFAAQKPGQHQSYAKHLTAEKQVEEFRAGDGMISTWLQIRDANHWLDATALACVAGHAAGMRLIEAPPPPPAPEPSLVPAEEAWGGRRSESSSWADGWRGRH